MLNNIEKQLVEKYKELYKPLDWSFPVYPAIPFVGRHLAKSKRRVISYASAENLTYAYDKDNQPKDKEIHKLGDKQYYRSRYFCERKKQKEDYFPFVHMNPFNNGSQLVVTRYVLTKLGYDDYFANKPHEFIEQISIANFGKFSINYETNKRKNTDYARDKNKISDMIRYITTDISLIKPDIIIIPKTIFNTANKIKNWEELLRESKINKRVQFVLIYQVNSQNINTHISKMPNDAVIRRYGLLKYSSWLAESKVRRLEKYLSWLDEDFSKKVKTYSPNRFTR